MRWSRCCLLALMLLPGACQTFQEKPAVLVAPDDEARAELNAVVSSLLDGTPVTLADDAFTESSMVTLERKRHETIEGRPATGRIMTPPEKFHLLLKRGDCIIEHMGTGNRHVLEKSRCVPE